MSSGQVHSHPTIVLRSSGQRFGGTVTELSRPTDALRSHGRDDHVRLGVRIGNG